MAENNNAHNAAGPQDPLGYMIADGRVAARPILHHGLPDVITVDLERLAGFLGLHLPAVFNSCGPLRNRYLGSHNQVTTAITNDVTMVINYAIAQTYNRLRSVLECKYSTLRANRMNPRAPVPQQQEFPEWLSATLGAIGPLRVRDGPSDRLLVYASPANTAQNFGRDNAIVFDDGGYSRFMEAYRACGFRTAPFPSQYTEGRAFTTLTPIFDEGIFRLYGSLHSSHYENEDVVRIALCSNVLGTTPFEYVGATLGFVNDNATVTALTAVAAPEGIPAGQAADSAGRPVGCQYRVNYFGIQPGVAAQGTTPAVAAGFYVYGRGVTRIYQCSLADQVSPTEVYECFRHRLLR